MSATRPRHLAQTPVATRRRRLVAGIAVSSLGDGLLAVALPLLAVRLTTKPLLVAGIAVAGSLPWLLFGLPAGALADRVERSTLVLVVDLARFAMVGGLGAVVAFSHPSVGELYVAAFAVGAGETIVTAATKSAVPLLAEERDRPRLNGRVNAAETAGVEFAGPAAGGAAFAWRAWIPFVGDALTYLVSALLVERATAHLGPPPERSRTTIASDVRQGLSWFASSRSLRVLASIVASFAFCQAAVLSVLVIYATRVLGLHGAEYGVLLSVAALGDVASSLLAGRVHGRLGPFLSLLVAGTLAGAAYVLLGGTSRPYVAVVALALEAAGSSLGNVTTLSLRQRLIPPERFGLVSNAFRMCVFGAVPLGALAGGALTAAIGTRPTFVVAGIAQLAALAAMAVPLRLVAIA
ncbi:MAG: MFS transporter [Actinomycetota bacterium]|nr:MFS transporter [Actinomycetota bacterium]